MDWTAKQLAPQEILGPVLRVVRDGSSFHCSLCKSEYGHPGEAASCLQACWRDFQTLPLTVYIARKSHFRCRYCVRAHAVESAARECAIDCKNRLQYRFAIEISFDGEQYMNLPNRKSLLHKRAPQVVVAAPQPKKVKTEEAPPQEMKAPDTVNVDVTPVAPSPPPPEPAVEAAPAATEDAAPAERKQKNNEHEMFYRDNARYACVECNKRFFTKNEVVACYKAHFEEAAPASA